MVPGAEPRLYVDIKDQGHMQRIVTEYMSDFNATSKKPMHLVLFQVGGWEGGGSRLVGRREQEWGEGRNVLGPAGGITYDHYGEVGDTVRYHFTCLC